jgi:hypothetical protein
MEPRDFCYWLQGYLELTNNAELNELQLELVGRHLNLVLKKHPLMTAGLVPLVATGVHGLTGAQC